MNTDDELVNYIAEQYNVIENEDGSYTIKTNKSVYLLKKLDNFNAKSNVRGLNDDSLEKESSDKLINQNIGRDDLYPNFDTPKFEDLIKQKKHIQGMLGSFDNREWPIIQYDPAKPGKKKKSKFPEPDPDNLDPGKFYDPED